MPRYVHHDMAIKMRMTHFQPGGEVCETAVLTDGRTLRVIGHEAYKSISWELRAWLALLGLAMLLWGCGGAEFSYAPEAPDAGESSAPDDSGRGGSLDAGRGDSEATTEAGCSAQHEPCMNGYGPLADGGCGCETANGCTLVEHDDGLGGHWTDCAALGTHDEAEATAACKAAGGAQCAPFACGVDGGLATDVCSCGIPPWGCVCWSFSGAGAGHVASSTLSPECAGAGDWHWQ